MVVANKEINETQNTPQMLAILITNAVVQYGVDVSQFSVRYEYLLWALPAKARR